MDLLKSRARPWPYPPVDLWDLLHSPHPTSFKLLPYSPNSSYQLLLPLSFNSSSFNLSYFLLSPIPSKHLLLTLSTSSYLLPKGLRWLVSGIDFMHEEISRLFCSEKFYDCGGWHCNYSYKLQVSVRLEIDMAIEIFRVHMEISIKPVNVKETLIIVYGKKSKGKSKWSYMILWLVSKVSVFIQKCFSVRLFWSSW